MGHLRAGYATEDCTPREPRQLSGYGPGTLERVSTGVHTPLAAKAVVFDDGTSTVALVSVDLLNVYAEFTERVRRQVADLGIDHVLLTATHTHAAPYMPGRFLEVNPLLSYDEEMGDYVDRVETAVVEAIRTAHRRLSGATLSIGRAENDTVPYNRRRENGPIDPELVVMHVSMGTGDEVVVVNFACHPVCTNARETLVSADWPGVMYEKVFDETGLETMFINGATGDVNPRTSRGARSGPAVYDYMEAIGTSIAETVFDALADARQRDPLSSPEISIEGRPLELAIKHLDSRENIRERYDELTAEIERYGGVDEKPDFQQLQSADDPRAGLLLDRWYVEERCRLSGWGIDAFETSLTHVRIGEVGVLSIPGEAFVRHGLDLKQASRDDTLFVAGFADDYVGYFPTVSAFEDGGYEVQTCKFAPVAMTTFRRAGFDLLSR